MRKKRLFLSVAWFAVVMEVAWSFPTEAAPANEALTIGYSSFSGHYVPLWIAVEDRLGRKYGLDLKAVYAGRARPQQLLMSGETPLVVATGTGALTSHVLGVKDQVTAQFGRDSNEVQALGRKKPSEYKPRARKPKTPLTEK